MSWFRRVELKPACILLLVVTVTFLHAQIYYLCRTSFIFVFSQRSTKNHIAVITHQSEQTFCAYQTFSEIEGQQAYLRSFFCCSSNNSQSFFIFHYIVLFSNALWIFSVLYNNNFLYANCPFHSLWSRERQLPAVTSIQLTLFP